MHPILHRALKAYRPLYPHGLLRDGQYRLPVLDAPNEPWAPSRSTRPRMLLLALTGLHHHLFSKRS
ncbi:hypothetical protein [Rhodanobacter terrae]|uniref:Uncharacterized protein n=1 Tax=Rhodanobacter terrae TaxID=418647 RepID=A0ABW0SWU1_9GAMM